MDLLVQDGWVPSYSIAAVLLQIRVAISSTEPRPARLARGTDWKRPYNPQEAFEGDPFPNLFVLQLNSLQDLLGQLQSMAGACQKEPDNLCCDEIC